MSVKLALPLVVKMQAVLTLMEATFVHAYLGSLEMELIVMVRMCG